MPFAFLFDILFQLLTWAVYWGSIILLCLIGTACGWLILWLITLPFRNKEKEKIDQAISDGIKESNWPNL
jgi:hypothetical protein